VPPAIGTAHVPQAPAATGSNGGRAAANGTPGSNGTAIGMASVTLPGGIPRVVPPTTATGTASVPVVASAPPVAPSPETLAPDVTGHAHADAVTTATPADIARPAPPVSVPPAPAPVHADAKATVETAIPISRPATGKPMGAVLPFPVVPAATDSTDTDSPSGTSGLPGASAAADADTRSLRHRGSHRSRPLRWVAASVALPAVGVLVMSSGGSVTPQSASAEAKPASAALKAPGPVEIRADAGPAIGQQQLPAGWSWYQYPTGFRVAAPSAWPLVWEEQIEAYFCEPHGDRMLVFSPMNLEGREPVDALIHEESEDPLPGYQRLSVTPVSYRGGAADIQYLYNDPKRGIMHGINRSFVVDGKGYLIEWRTKPAEWDANLPTFVMVANSFDAPRERAVHVE
jgi:hypothetical protein